MKLSKEDIEKVVEMYKEGSPYNKMAYLFNVSDSTILRALRPYRKTKEIRYRKSWLEEKKNNGKEEITDESKNT